MEALTEAGLCTCADGPFDNEEKKKVFCEILAQVTHIVASR